MLNIYEGIISGYFRQWYLKWFEILIFIIYKVCIIACKRFWKWRLPFQVRVPIKYKLVWHVKKINSKWNMIKQLNTRIKTNIATTFWAVAKLNQFFKTLKIFCGFNMGIKAIPNHRTLYRRSFSTKRILIGTWNV